MVSCHQLTVFVSCLILLASGVSGQCPNVNSQTATQTSATSFSNSPQPYSNGHDCKWSLSTTASRIVLNFDSLSLEWNYDFAKLFDGSSTSANEFFYSKNDRYNTNLIVSSGTNIYMTFTSDYSITYNGFDVTFIGVPATPSCDVTLTPTSSDQTAYYYYAYYGRSCFIVITATSLTDRIQYSVPVASVSSFQVMDGSYQSLPTGASSYVSSGSSITLTGSSSREFVVVYKQVASTVTASIVSSASASVQSICSGATLSTTTSTQTVASGNYPNSYDNNVNCYVTLTSSDSTKSVLLTVTDWEVDYGDVLNVYDGPSTIYNLLATSNDLSLYTGRTLTSTGQSLHLVFSSDSIGTLRGFQMTFIQTSRVVPTCSNSYPSVTASTTGQTLTSPNYPSMYNNNLDMFWLITKPTESDNLVLDVTVMNIEEATSCQYDVLTFYDGACQTSPVIAAVCGTNPVTFEDSTGLYVLVRFKTDSSVTLSGFSMTYSIGSFEDDDDVDSFDVKDWIIPLIVLIVLVVLTIGLAIGCYVHVRRGRMRKVKDQTTAEKKSTQPKHKLARKLTTHQLLEQFKTRYKERDTHKYNSPTPTPQGGPGFHHPSPNPPGPNTIIMDRNQMTPHPPPQPAPSPPQFDPAYPPLGPNMSAQVTPVMPPGQTPAYLPPLFPPPGAHQGAIPPPFSYITPAQARTMNVPASQGPPM